VNSDVIDEALFEELRTAAGASESSNQNALIRRLHTEFDGCLKSHLAVLFSLKFSTLSKILGDPDHGTRAVGRPRILTRAQEDEVLLYIRNSQMSGHAATFREVTMSIQQNFGEAFFRVDESNDHYISSRFFIGNL
jgi:hypothetical protein